MLALYLTNETFEARQIKGARELKLRHALEHSKSMAGKSLNEYREFQ
ncbi:hypothetical protein ACCQ05_02885 [Xanthomonas sp. NCPPB 3582]